MFVNLCWMLSCLAIFQHLPLAPQKKCLCRGKGKWRCCCDCVAFPFLGVCLTPQTHSFCRVGREGEEKRNTLQKNVLQGGGGGFVEVRGKSFRRGNEILHDWPQKKKARAQMSKHVTFSTRGIIHWNMLNPWAFKNVDTARSLRTCELICKWMNCVNAEIVYVLIVIMCVALTNHFSLCCVLKSLSSAAFSSS